MQGWPLERKIQVTQAKILEWYLRYKGNVYVSFSGGKDSTVLLDLVRRAFPEVLAVFVDTGLEYPEIREFVRTVDNVEWLRPSIPFNRIITTYGYPVISKDVAKRIYYARRGSPWAINQLNGLSSDGMEKSIFAERFMKHKYLVDAPFPISNKCCYYMKEAPFLAFEKQTKRMPFIGTMACESFQRQSNYLKTGCNGFGKKRPTSQPLSFWTEQDVLRYLQLTGIPYATIYGDIITKKLIGPELMTSGAYRTGCMFCMFGVHLEKEPNRFQKMQHTHPQQYDYCINHMGCGAVLDYLNVPYAA